MAMNKTMRMTLAAASLALAATAQAGTITDNYNGATDAQGNYDVIGSSTYDISGATITRAGTSVTITINTAFAGHAGMDSGIQSGGIGYGDVFLSKLWTPAGSASDRYAIDNASNGTLWSYGLALDNRMSNTGGNFTLYKLNGSTNASNLKTSNQVMTCTNPSQCIYRTGQADVVNTAGTVTNTNVTGKWTVTTDQKLVFSMTNVSSTDLINWNSFAMHWGETCQNDVIEGQTSVVPLPGTLPMLALGLGALVTVRRRRTL
jgi:hypothetical protein